MKFYIGIVCFLSCVLSKHLVEHNQEWWKNDPKYFKKEIRMPNAISDKPDSLICHAAKLDDQEAYILKYEPRASKKIAHHMMVYGCGQPGSSQPYWPCGEMDDRSDVSVCNDGQRQIVYAWAMNANSRELPEGVGFRVSGSTNIKYLVIQMHYKDMFEANQTDNSGVVLHMTHTPQPKQAGFYVLGNYGYIPPLVKNFHMESACEYRKENTIYPIGYRTHSHNLGVVTSGYRLRNGIWTEIGRMSPQLPQTFYDVTHNGIDIKKGDILAARCTMTSDREEITAIGPTNKDEMCNFYILYYTYHKTNTLDVKYCFRDAQTFHWKEYLKNIPDTNASSIDGIPEFHQNDPFVKASSQRQPKHVQNQDLM